MLIVVCGLRLGFVVVVCFAGLRVCFASGFGRLRLDLLVVVFVISFWYVCLICLLCIAGFVSSVVAVHVPCFFELCLDVWFVSFYDFVFVVLFVGWFALLFRCLVGVLC